MTGFSEIGVTWIVIPDFTSPEIQLRFRQIYLFIIGFSEISLTWIVIPDLTSSEIQLRFRQFTFL